MALERKYRDDPHGHLRILSEWESVQAYMAPTVGDMPWEWREAMEEALGTKYIEMYTDRPVSPTRLQHILQKADAKKSRGVRFK